MKTRFYLRKSTKTYSINFEFRNSKGNIRLRTSTGYSLLNSKDWDNKKEKLKLPCAVFEAAEINVKLSEALLKFNYAMKAIDENNTSENSIYFIIMEAFGKKNIASDLHDNEIELKDSLIKYYNWFLKYYAIHNSPFTKKPLSPGSLKTYKTGLSRLEDYISDRKIKNFSFADCSRNFYNDYIIYLNEKKYSKNYIGTIVQKLKTILSFSYDEGFHKNSEFKKSYFSKVVEEIDHIYLTVEELQRIRVLELNDPILDNVRDIFLLCSYTGLRISDMLALLKKSTQVIYIEDGIKYFKLKQMKTSNTVIIPLNSIVTSLLEKRSGNLPEYVHSTIINSSIKSICKRAKITEIHTFSRTIGGVVQEISQPKYKLVASHTARRSFCTNAYKSGMPIQDIMSISGHKSERIFLSYVKVEKVENAKRISQHPFFN